MSSILFALFVFLLQGPPAQAPGSVEGYVVRLGTSTPVARARVNLRVEGGNPAAQGRVAGPLTATTDAGGKFAIPNVPPGRYRLSASRDGFMPAQFGERGGGGPGAVLAVESARQLKDIVIALT